MTNNTIPNVPRELLERARASVASTNTSNWSSDLLRDIHAILSAPSPAGVDGLGVATFLHTLHMELGQTEQLCSKWNGDPFGVAGVDYSNTYSVTSEPLCRLSDAQAIIDGLRGEVEEWRLRSQYNADTAHDVASERDQQAQRIGELEGLLLEACQTFKSYFPGENPPAHNAMIKRIDAALSAGKK